MSSTTTSSTATAHNGSGEHNGGHAPHHGGPLDKLKGVFHNRPSSRDRHGDREVSLDRTTTGGTGEAGYAPCCCLLRERKASSPYRGKRQDEPPRRTRKSFFDEGSTELMHLPASCIGICTLQHTLMRPLPPSAVEAVTSMATS